VKCILNDREWRLEAERDGKRASQKSTRPAKPGRDSGVNRELSTKWAKATGVLLATRYRIKHSANYLRRERTKGQQKQRRLLEVEVVAKRSRVAETPQLELIALVGRLWATDQGRVRMSSEEPRKKAKKKLVTNTGSLLVMACV
jgi:hypothetical protein